MVTRRDEPVVLVAGTGDAGVMARVASAVGLLVREGDVHVIDLSQLVSGADAFLGALYAEVERWAVTVTGDRRLVPA